MVDSVGSRGTRAFRDATIARFRGQHLAENTEELKKLLDERKVDDILLFLQKAHVDTHVNFKYAVIYLVTHNDPDILEQLLEWGKRNRMEEKVVLWEDEEDQDKIEDTEKQPDGGNCWQGMSCISSSSGGRSRKSFMSSMMIKEEENGNEDALMKKNPIKMSVLQGYVKCSRLLHRFGWRIPQVRGEARLEGAQEAVRQKTVTCQQNNQMDQVKKYLTFKAYTRPYYLSLGIMEESRISEEGDIHRSDLEDLQHLDPLRRAFALAEEAENITENGKGMTELNYANIEADLGTYMHSILTQCANMEEVEVILSHIPEDNVDNVDYQEEGNWQKPLRDGHKDFVAHPFYQQYFWRMMAGEAECSERLSHLHWQIVYTPYVLLLFACYPFVVIADYFRRADIIFKPTFKPHAKSTDKSTDLDVDGYAEESPFFSFFRCKIHTPVFRMIFANVIQLIYLALLVITIENPEKTEARSFTWYIALTATFTAFFLLEDFMRMLTFKNFRRSFWNPYSLVSHVMIVLGGLTLLIDYFVDVEGRDKVDRADLSGNHVVNIAGALMSIGAGLEFFKTLRVALLSEYLGPVVLCVITVFKPLARMGLIFITIYLAHAVCQWSLYRPFIGSAGTGASNYTLHEGSSFNSTRGLFTAFFWIILEPEHSTNVQIIRNGLKGDFSLEFSHFIGQAVWAVYQIIVVILLLNVLIAIMNTCYAEVWERAEKEWKYSKTYYQATYLTPRACFPSPFGLFFYLTKLIYHLKNYSASNKKRRVGMEKKKKKYFKLLKELITVAQQRENETTEDDSFSDLKIDLFEEMKRIGLEIGAELRAMRTKGLQKPRHIKLF